MTSALATLPRRVWALTLVEMLAANRPTDLELKFAVGSGAVAASPNALVSRNMAPSQALQLTLQVPKAWVVPV